MKLMEVKMRYVKEVMKFLKKVMIVKIWTIFSQMRKIVKEMSHSILY